MKPTPEQVLEALKKHEPSVGGYGSEWEAEAADDDSGVVLRCLCDWLPRHTTPTRLVLDLGTEGLTQCDEEEEGEAEFWSFQELVDWVEGYGG